MLKSRRWNNTELRSYVFNRRVGAGSGDLLASCSIIKKQLKRKLIASGLRKEAVQHQKYVKGATMYPLEHNLGHGQLCTVPTSWGRRELISWFTAKFSLFGERKIIAVSCGIFRKSIYNQPGILIFPPCCKFWHPSTSIYFLLIFLYYYSLSQIKRHILTVAHFKKKY